MRTTSGEGRCIPQQGFTLVEVMVALVVLSIGLLGVAKLVTGAVRANDSGYMRGQATQLAYEMLDEIRANKSGAASYGGAGAYTDCIAASCTPAKLAGLDTYNWQQRVAATLPGGVGVIATAAGADGVIATVKVEWDDSEAQYAFGGAPGLTAVTLESVL
jgi:type IV pilus assembly protein PilV